MSDPRGLVPPMVRQGEILSQLGRTLVLSNEASEWSRLVFTCSHLSSTAEYWISLLLASGEEIPGVLSRDAKSLSRELRSAMYEKHKGTWFGMRMEVTSAHQVTTRFNYDEESEFSPPGVDPIAYVTDQMKFPRDEDKQPEWLKQRLAEGRARLAARGE